MVALHQQNILARNFILCTKILEMVHENECLSDSSIMGHTCGGVGVAVSDSQHVLNLIGHALVLHLAKKTESTKEQKPGLLEVETR